MARRRRSQHSSLLLLLPLPLWRAKRICSRCSADSPLTLTPFPCLSTPPPFSRPRQQRQEMLQRRKKEAKSNYKHTPGQSSATGSPLSLPSSILRLSLFPSRLQASLCCAHCAAYALPSPTQQLPHLYIHPWVK